MQNVFIHYKQVVLTESAYLYYSKNFKNPVDTDILSSILVVVTPMGTLNIGISHGKRKSFLYDNQITEIIQKETPTLLFILLASFKNTGLVISIMSEELNFDRMYIHSTDQNV